MAAAPLAVLAGCGGTSTPSASSPIAVGYELPLTGTVALPGKQEQEGWNLGLKEFGQSVDGHRIVTYFEDTGYGPYVSAIPKTTQAVFAETLGAGAIDFTKAYAQFGLRGKIPLYGTLPYRIWRQEFTADSTGCPAA